MCRKNAMTPHKTSLVAMVAFLAISLAGCGPTMYLSAPKPDKDQALYYANYYLDKFENDFRDGAFTNSEYSQYDSATKVSRYYTAKKKKDANNQSDEIPHFHYAKTTCLRAGKLWPNSSIDISNTDDGLRRAIDQRYGILHEYQGVDSFFRDYSYNNPKLNQTSYQLYVVGDGSQILSIYQKLIDPKVGCNLVNLKMPTARVKQYFRLTSFDAEPDIARLYQPLTNKDSFLKAAAYVDRSARAITRRYEEDLEENSQRNEARSAYFAKKREEDRQRNAEHFANTYSRVMSQTAAFANNHNQTMNAYRREADQIYQRSQWASSGSTTTTSSSQNSGRNSRQNAARLQEMNETIMVADAIDKSHSKHSNNKQKEPVKGTKYTKVSIESHGTTDMHFPHEQALNLAETNAYTAAASSCAKQHGRLEKGSGTLAKKSCNKNNNDEFRCEVHMLFTCSISK